jgi:hypothetical protein
MERGVALRPGRNRSTIPCCEILRFEPIFRSLSSSLARESSFS